MTTKDKYTHAVVVAFKIDSNNPDDMVSNNELLAGMAGKLKELLYDPRMIDESFHVVSTFENSQEKPND